MTVAHSLVEALLKTPLNVTSLFFGLASLIITYTTAKVNSSKLFPYT